MTSVLSRARKAVVVGGGVSGPALAIALRRIGYEVDILEQRPAAATNEGAFLNLAPNGMRALKLLRVGERLREVGFHSRSIRFFNSRGRQIGVIDSSCELDRFGAENLMIMRGDLHEILCDEAERAGADLILDKRLADVYRSAEGEPTALIAEAPHETGDILVGCDGIHSRVRRHILPLGAAPTYTGILDCGGISRLPAGTIEPGVQHMTFGQNAFFGYVAKPDGEVWWFSNIPWPDEPRRDELDAITAEAWHQRLVHLHGADPRPIPDILDATIRITGKWPLHIMPNLPRWHSGPVGMIGDAAHAIPPHSGQGASLAIEDALVLAVCLRDIPDIDSAFATFESLRRPRVERIAAEARRIGDRKTPGPLQSLFRDLLLPVFLKMGASKAAENYFFDVDWEEKVVPVSA